MKKTDDEWATIKLEVSIDLIYTIIKQLNPSSKITKEQIGDLLAKWVVEALERAGNATVKELEEMWGLCDKKAK
jgi:hypothetical protein